jgi:hypothetical protein
MDFLIVPLRPTLRSRILRRLRQGSSHPFVRTNAGGNRAAAKNYDSNSRPIGDLGASLGSAMFLEYRCDVQCRL